MVAFDNNVAEMSVGVPNDNACHAHVYVVRVRTRKLEDETVSGRERTRHDFEFPGKALTLIPGRGDWQERGREMAASPHFRRGESQTERIFYTALFKKVFARLQKIHSFCSVKHMKPNEAQHSCQPPLREAETRLLGQPCIFASKRERQNGPRVWPHGRRHFAAVCTAFIGQYDTMIDCVMFSDGHNNSGLD